MGAVMGRTFLANYGQVLLAVAADPRRTIRQIADHPAFRAMVAGIDGDPVRREFIAA